jgi:two-component system CheB/CheR fusion protein
VIFTGTTMATRPQQEVKQVRVDLETAYEELQSTNEELETINGELRMRTGELNEAQTFLEGVMSSVAAAVVVLDTGLRVRTWNSGAEDIWVNAMNRRGRAITCAISCSPLNEAREGVVLLMEEQPATDEQPATRESA